MASVYAGSCGMSEGSVAPAYAMAITISGLVTAIRSLSLPSDHALLARGGKRLNTREVWSTCEGLLTVDIAMLVGC